jgi:zinc/manganese transport system substrate-binding protein
MRTKWWIAVLMAIGAPGLAAGCAASPGATNPGSGSGGLRVVAAENVWGDIATQLGGDRVTVTSIIDSPDADPHDYEATAADGRAVATADVVLINGLGYDTWATRLAEANPVDGRAVLTVADVVGAAEGANPHRWYNPEDVARVTDRLVAEYKRLDPPDAAYFDQRRSAFDASLAEYTALITQIRSTYAGTPVGASESLFAMLAPALGLNLVTPAGFLTAVSEGVEPTAADKAAIDTQISQKQIKVYVYNSQNATPDVQRQIAAATARQIPISAITETLSPATASWQQWQSAQLTALRAALKEAAG